ncbi:MAG: hypothetical protein AB1861_28465 [Cyanobacteriota bacterium]
MPIHVVQATLGLVMQESVGLPTMGDGFGGRTLQRRELYDCRPGCAELSPVLCLVPRWQWLN